MRICRTGCPSASATRASSSPVSQARFGYSTSILKRANPIGQSYAGSLSDVWTSQQGTTTRSSRSPRHSVPRRPAPTSGRKRAQRSAGRRSSKRLAPQTTTSTSSCHVACRPRRASSPKHPGQHDSGMIRRIFTGLPVRIRRNHRQVVVTHSPPTAPATSRSPPPTRRIHPATAPDSFPGPPPAPTRNRLGPAAAPACARTGRTGRDHTLPRPDTGRAPHTVTHPPGRTPSADGRCHMPRPRAAVPLKEYMCAPIHSRAHRDVRAPACGHSPAAGTGWAGRPAATHIPHTGHHQRQHRLKCGGSSSTHARRLNPHHAPDARRVPGT